MDEQELEQAKQVAQQLFGKIGTENGEKLAEFPKDKLNQWKARLDEYRIICNTGTLPGKKEIIEALETLNKVLPTDNTNEFLKKFNASEDELVIVEEDVWELDDFYGSQIPLWNKLQTMVTA